MNRFFTILTAISISFGAHAQNGLEKIIVEKYYISDANDATQNDVGGVLPVGSVTYRIYVDMLPGYIFQAAYGVQSHELKIATSTSFFNNEDRGDFTPKFSISQVKKNTVMLDSWLSVGSACTDHYGILKTDDDGINTIKNSDGVLANNDPNAGVPISQQDGFLEGTPEVPTFVSLSNILPIFDSQNITTNGQIFSTFDGAWASLAGSVGPDSTKNRVLIAQITTNGEFTFDLNLQIRSPQLVIENYVARNPVGLEKTIPSLIYPDTTTVKTFELSSEDFIIYPNPVNDEIILVFDNKGSNKNFYKIYDITGAIVGSGTLPIFDKHTNFPINVSNLHKGIYLVQVSLDGSIKSSKFIKL